jgi:hypothetical protein
MSYDIKPSACLVYFGIRFLSAKYIDDDTDQRVKKAKAHGLSTWAGRRYPPTAAGKRPHFLLVGAYVCSAAFDGSCEASKELARLQQLVKSTIAKLLRAGFTQAPELWIQCRYD